MWKRKFERRLFGWFAVTRTRQKFLQTIPDFTVTVRLREYYSNARHQDSAVTACCHITNCVICERFCWNRFTCRAASNAQHYRPSVWQYVDPRPSAHRYPLVRSQCSQTRPTYKLFCRDCRDGLAICIDRVLMWTTNSIFFTKISMRM